MAGKRKHPVARCIGLVVLAAAVIFGAGCAVVKWTAGKSAATPRTDYPAVELTWADAMADATLTHKEIAMHFAPEIDAAVNVLLSDGGRGDFITAVYFDGDMAANNNWANMTKFPLNAVVYYSVQETETHYFVGYDFYHPRDDAEIWLDRHENDFEGIMLAVRKADGGFGTVEVMYTQGHGGVPFFFEENTGLRVREGSHRDGGLLMDGEHPVIYITPNGTLSWAGHSVESAKEHSVYWSVGNSGIRYYYGGAAEEPSTYNGAYTDNPCSYELRSLDELWNLRNGPYGDGCVFAEYGAFCGDDYEENAANPAWAWRNKTAWGFGGSFLSDPAWTFACALDGLENFSHTYVSNDYADWQLTVSDVTLHEALPAGTSAHVMIRRNGADWSNTVWNTFTAAAGETVPVVFEPADVSTLWVAAPADTQWEVLVVNDAGEPIDASVTVSVAYIG